MMNFEDKMDEIRFELGDSMFIREIVAWFGTEAMDEFLNEVARCWDINLEKDCED